MKTIVFTGGGTGGHVIPNIALFDEIRKIFDRIYYIGSFNGIEKDIISKYPFVEYIPIPTVKLVRSLTPKNLLLPFKLIKSVHETKKILKEIKPDVIFSKGGFVSVPVVLAGSKLKIPIIAHESDSTIGLANKIVLRKCNKMCFSFERLALKYKKKGVYSGSPIRPAILKGNKEKVIKDLALSPYKQTILIMGGSLGAKAINNIIFDNINELTKKYNVIHIVGKNNVNKKTNAKNYKQLEFVNDIENYLACADLIISRSGSNSIFEFLELKKPMILIPLPLDCSRGDQIINAQIFEKNGFASVLEQNTINKNILFECIENTLKNKQKFINNMKKANTPNGNKIIIEEIKKVL